MTEDELVRQLEASFEMKTGSLSASTRLEEIDAWDSLGVLSVLALFDEKLGVRVEAGQLAKSETVSDLVQVVRAYLT